jgi:hypothetical protein
MPSRTRQLCRSGILCRCAFDRPLGNETTTDNQGRDTLEDPDIARLMKQQQTARTIPQLRF